MGAGIARNGDTFAGGLVAGSGAIIATTTQTFVNGRAVARVGDKMLHWHFWPGHYWFQRLGTIITGSATVSAEGKAVARIGDQLDCGCIITSGSTDTFSG